MTASSAKFSIMAAFGIVALTAWLGPPLLAGTAGTETYSYDALGRLRVVKATDGTLSNFIYDNAGNRKSAALGVDVSPPSVPGVPTFSNIGGTSATAKWAASTDNVAVTTYRLRLNAGAWTTVGNVLTTPLVGLASYTAYATDVQAGDAAGNWSASASASFRTLDVTAPGAPTGLTGNLVSTTQINLSWTASTDNVGVTGYRIYRGGSQIGTSATTTYSDTTVVLGNTYSYTVAAVDAAGNVSAQSTAASISNLNATDSATLTVGRSGTVGSGKIGYFYRGFRTSPVLGTYVSSTLTGGRIVYALYDYCSNSNGGTSGPSSCPQSGFITQSQLASLTVTGFTSDPGASWLISATAAGATRTGAAASYSYSTNGAATWQWIGPAGTGQFGLPVSGSVAVTLVHR